MAQSPAHKHDSTRRATYQDVLDAPAHRVAEIVDGTLHTHPRPAPPHAVASSRLGDRPRSGPFDRGRGGPGGWWIIDEPELHSARTSWSRTSRGGAGSGWRSCPTRRTSPSRRIGCARCSPPRRASSTCTAKRPVYAREGVPYLWLVDPADRTLEAFELHDGQWLLIASAKDDEPVSIRPFDAITFSLGDLWP